MKKYIILVILYSLIVSCTDNDDNSVAACDVNNPVQDLEWLRMEIERRNENPTEDMKYCYIIQATLDGEDVFVYEDCNPLINKAILFFNCEGSLINLQGNQFNLLQNQKIIWSRNDFVCQVSF